MPRAMNSDATERDAVNRSPLSQPYPSPPATPSARAYTLVNAHANAHIAFGRLDARPRSEGDAQERADAYDRVRAAEQALLAYCREIEARGAEPVTAAPGDRPTNADDVAPLPC
jgi:hypothetical protein